MLCINANDTLPDLKTFLSNINYHLQGLLYIYKLNNSQFKTIRDGSIFFKGSPYKILVERLESFDRKSMNVLPQSELR